MKASRLLFIIDLLLILVLFNSCSAVAGIFKAGMGFGIFIVFLVIAVIAMIAMRARKK